MLNSAPPVDPFNKSPFASIGDPIEKIAKTMRNVGWLIIGSSLVKGLFNTVAHKFFETESLPVKTTYVDWWPRTCQKVKEFGSKFWSRRAEGATVGAFSSSLLMTSWFFSD